MFQVENVFGGFNDLLYINASEKKTKGMTMEMENRFKMLE